jgi:hypothetical protein
MPYTMEDLVRETLDELVEINPDEVLKRLPVEKRLEGLSPEERLEGLSAEELIKGIPLETLEALLRELKAKGSTSEPN